MPTSWSGENNPIPGWAGNDRGPLTPEQKKKRFEMLSSGISSGVSMPAPIPAIGGAQTPVPPVRMEQPRGNERPPNLLMLARADQRAAGKYTFIPWETTGDGQARMQTSFAPSLLNSSGALKVEIANGVLSVGAGAGLSNSGTTTAPILDVNVDNSTLQITADTLLVKDLGITAAKLAADAVTTAKILDVNVTTAKLGPLTALTAADVALTDEVPEYNASAAANRKVTVERLLGYADVGICNGRLTLETGVPVSTSDQTSKTTIYFTPYNGNRIALYDGTRWKLYTFTERSLSLGTLTSGKNYDVFIYDNSGTLTLEFSAAWSSDTARTDALTTQDGVYVKSGSTTRRYLGTFRTTSTTTTEDSDAKRFVWNMYNRTQRRLRKVESTASWTYTSATIRNWNNSSSNRVEFVLGLAGDPVDIHFQCTAINSVAGNPLHISLGVDSTSVESGLWGIWFNTSLAVPVAKYAGFLSLGYHYIQALESANASTATFYGVGGGADQQGGMLGSVAA